jgi:molecular chaperone GrpE
MSEKDENISGLEENLPETESAPCDQKDTGGEKEKKEKRSEIRKLKGELETANRELADLRKNLDETTDKYMRLAAEYDNFRKRTQTDRANVYGDAVSDTLTKLLPVIDNLQYAAKYSSGEPEKLAEGLAMILGKLPETLEKLNVKAFGEVGDKFDPNLHNAVLHTEDENYGEGEIVDVMQCGYRYGDRILRYAMVKVAN